VLVGIEANGMTGFGEASMPPSIGETPDGAMHFLAAAQSLLPADPAGLSSAGIEALPPLLARVDALAPGCHAAKAAVDIALHDWLGKSLGQPCHRLWEIDPVQMPLTSYTIGIGDPAFVRERVSEAAAFRILKVKLGGGNDREIIETIRNMTDVPVRVDANQGWTDREEAARMVDWLAGKGVELVEQPFPRDRAEDTAWLRARSNIPLVADESVVRYADLQSAAGVFDGVNMKCTGMAEAYRMILEARRLGLRIMLGCMTETSCGISAAAQLAPLVDWVDLDGALLIANDPFAGSTVHEGRVTMPPGNGIGVEKRESME
jgi:L-alanine-DL-glutamate epimerase-like enolase superfamily enzyme